MHNEIILIAGPTAVGKTAAATRLARQLGTTDPVTGILSPLPVLSADSRQCYRELQIGVAKPSSAELAEVPHYFINTHSIHDHVNAAVFERYALDTLDMLFQSHRRVIVVGGTGLYLKALMYGLDEMPEIPPQVRQRIEDLYQEQGLESLRAAVQSEDPLFARDADLDNPQRMIRALEVIRATGRSIRDFQHAKPAKRAFRIQAFVLDLPREELYHRINARVDEMMAQGLLDEVCGLLPYKHLNALQTVGYRELFDYLEGKTSLMETVETIKKNSRHYAKRQLTWFRSDPVWQWVHPDQDLSLMID
jgi:tRNA dimethylallyltransferase